MLLSSSLDEEDEEPELANLREDVVVVGLAWSSLLLAAAGGGGVGADRLSGRPRVATGGMFGVEEADMAERGGKGVAAA
jgi:hypothetical protein